MLKLGSFLCVLCLFINPDLVQSYLFVNLPSMTVKAMPDILSRGDFEFTISAMLCVVFSDYKFLAFYVISFRTPAVAGIAVTADKLSDLSLIPSPNALRD